MTGADVGASHGRPEYVIPSLDLDGYFQKFFAERKACLASLRTSGDSPWPVGGGAIEPPVGIPDTDAWIRIVAEHPDLGCTLPWSLAADALQKKFAVFGRLHASYDAAFRKTTDAEVAPSSLCRLASFFLRRFRTDTVWNDLNTAIKLLDKAVSSWKSGADDPGLPAELERSLSQELVVLEGLVHAHE